jgi:ABC-2 type transport system ATP-binding protein
MIQAIDLTKRYDNGTLALDALNLKIGPGEIYCLLGANGAGKTTTINLLLNFIAPTSGQALIQGIDVNENPLEAKKHVALLSENVMLYGNLTAVQNLRLFVELCGGAMDRAALERALADVGLPGHAFHRRVKEFSKGMRQKLAIAIAIHKNTEALLLDEPMSGLDPQASNDLVQTLLRLREQGKAILMSTHDIFRAKEMANYVGIMKDGRKLLECTQEELRHENLEKLYLTSIGRGADARADAPAAAS